MTQAAVMYVTPSYEIAHWVLRLGGRQKKGRDSLPPMVLCLR